MTDYRWTPIKPLSDEERAIDLAAMSPLYETWKAARGKLESSSGGNLGLFTKRLIRRLSVETGILERLYDLDRGTTEVLVASGFAEELVSGSSTDIEPTRLINLLRDQESAIKLVMDCVAGNRVLSKGFVHELHRILTQHQDTTTAVDQFGNRTEIPLSRGTFKRRPNNPRRADDSTHEYCPPIQVESEIENLLKWFSEYDGYDPIIVASWFHHRFTQIHPYQDGNGRVGRALITLMLLRADLLPLVIDRDQRTDYINALEAADSGDLAILALLFARIEREAILQALSVEEDADEPPKYRLAEAVIGSLAAKLDKRKQLKDAELRQADEVAGVLRCRASEILDRTFDRLKEPVSQLAEPEVRITVGGPDKGNAHWYKHEVVKSANQAGKFVNFNEAHFFVKVSARVDRERLVFVTSFHHVGRDLSGVMEATAFAQLQSFEDSEDRECASEDFFLCSLVPFVFTHRTNVNEIEGSFDRWLDEAVAVALKEYGDRL
jgi:Fic/DOC family